VPWILANCVGTDVEAWFPGGTNPTRDDAMLTRICNECEIKSQCLEWAIENDEVGYWGGEYFSQRRRPEEDECVEEIQPGGDGGGVLEVWSEAA
jgi:transcription factor WhiB